MSGNLRSYAFQIVARRVEAGDRIRFVHDFYGGQWIEFQHPWMFWRKKRMQLEPTEVMAIKAAMDNMPPQPRSILYFLGNLLPT